MAAEVVCPFHKCCKLPDGSRMKAGTILTDRPHILDLMIINPNLCVDEDNRFAHSTTSSFAFYMEAFLLHYSSRAKASWNFLCSLRMTQLLEPIIAQHQWESYPGMGDKVLSPAFLLIASFAH